MQPDVTHAGTRRELATHLLDRSEDFQVIQELLGHASIGTTYRHDGGLHACQREPVAGRSPEIPSAAVIYSGGL